MVGWTFSSGNEAMSPYERLLEDAFYNATVGSLCLLRGKRWAIIITKDYAVRRLTGRVLLEDFTIQENDLIAPSEIREIWWSASCSSRPASIQTIFRRLMQL